MIPFELNISTKIIFGIGKHREIGNYVKEYANKVLLIYGGGSIKRNGIYDNVVDSLKRNGIEWIDFGGVRPNPTVEFAREGIEICRKEKIEFLLAVGGGSVIDTAKIIAMGYDYEGDVWDFFDGKRDVDHALPIGTILTVPGTASEVSINCIINNEEKKEKRGAMSSCLRPIFSILDPGLCTTIPKKQISIGAYDAFCHTMERYFDIDTHADIVNGMAEGVMKGILRNARIAYENPSNLDAWGELMVGSDFAHSGITGYDGKGEWPIHPIEEVISGEYEDLPHGVGLAILAPAWMKYVYKKHLPIFVQFAVNVMGVSGPIANQEEIALEGIENLEKFARDLGLPSSFSEVGIDDSKMEYMAKLACGYKSTGVIGRMEVLTWKDVLNIYKSVL
jgi:alcohol dehydrogenase YqhD (iron-dependent ADH family)